MPHLAAVVLFALVACIYCRPALQGKILEQDDIIQWKGMAQDLFRYEQAHGRLPLWNNNLFSGMPAFQIAMDAHNPLSVQVLHSLFLLFLPKPAGFFFLLCISFYFLARVIRIRTLPSILGGIAYAYASYTSIIVAVGHDTKMQALGYMPALIGALWLIYTRRYAWGAALTALFSALLIAQNHLQITYYSLLLAGCMSVAFAIRWVVRKEYRHLLLASALAIGAGLTGAACNLVNLAATSDYSRATMRGGTSLQMNGTDAPVEGLPKNYAFNWSYGPLETFTLGVPNLYGGSSDDTLPRSSHVGRVAAANHVKGEHVLLQVMGSCVYWGPQPGTSGPVYLGAAICFLFIAGMCCLRTRHKWWMLFACAIAIFMSWGSHLAWFNDFLFYHLPFYNKFRAPSMVLVIPQLLFPLVAVMFLQQLSDDSNRNAMIPLFRKGAAIAAALLLAAVACYFVFDYVGHSDGLLRNYLQRNFRDTADPLYTALLADRKSLLAADLVRTFLLMAGVFVVLWYYIRQRIPTVFAFIMLLLITTADSWGIGKRFLNDSNYREPKLIEADHFVPRPVDSLILKDTSWYRVMDLSDETFEEATMSYYFHSAGGYHPAKLSIMEDLINYQLLKQPMNPQVLNMLNLKYLVVKDSATGELALRQNAGACGPCWLVKNIRFLPGPADMMRALGDFHPLDTALVESRYAQQVLPFDSTGTDSSASLVLRKNDNDDIWYTYNGRQAHFGVFSEVYYDRGWKAYVDGKETAIVPVDYVLRGIVIPPGKHDVYFSFRPASYYTSRIPAIIASAITWLLLLGVILYKWRRRKKN